MTIPTKNDRTKILQIERTSTRAKRRGSDLRPARPRPLQPGRIPTGVEPIATAASSSSGRANGQQTRNQAPPGTGIYPVSCAPRCESTASTVFAETLAFSHNPPLVSFRLKSMSGQSGSTTRVATSSAVTATTPAVATLRPSSRRKPPTGPAAAT